MNLNVGTSMAIPEVNVRIEARNVNTGKVTYQIEKHNRVMKSSLLTLIRVINGEFSEADDITVNTNKRFQLYNFIPRFIAFGSNVATGSNPGVTTEVTINDTKLLSEINYSKDASRMKLTQRNIIENNLYTPYIKLIIKHYVPVTAYVNEKIAEAGLFTEETGNNLWARVTFPTFTKDEATVIDVTWEITIVSMETSDSPYETVDKSGLWNAIDSAFSKMTLQNANYLDLTNALRDGIKSYASQSDSQDIVDEKTVKIITETNKI